jgi:type 1 fimbria pilin
MIARFCRLLRATLRLASCSLLGLMLLMDVATAAQKCTYTFPASTSFGDVNWPPNAPIGTSIGAPMDLVINYICPANPGTPASGFELRVQSALSLVSGFTDVWQLGAYPSVGVRLTDVTYGNTVLSNLTLGQNALMAPPITTGSATSGTIRLRGQLVKIDNNLSLSSYSLSVSPWFYIYSRDVVAGVNSTTDTLAIGSPTKIVKSSANSCYVTTGAVSAVLPTVSAAALPSVGSTAGYTSFSIGLNCSAVFTAYITITDATAPTNTSNQLTLDSSSTAAGIKLQILRNNGATVVNYGPDSSSVGNTNQWSITTSTGAQSIPLSVRYYRSGALTAGSVSASATFTMAYP